MFAMAALGLLVAMALALARAFRGPTVYDRILAVNVTGTLTVLLIAVHGFLSDRPEFLDLGLVYVLINFIATVAVTKYVRFSQMGHPVGEDERGDL